MLYYIQPGLLYKCFLAFKFFKLVFTLKVIHVQSKKKEKRKSQTMKKVQNEKYPLFHTIPTTLATKKSNSNRLFWWSSG